MRIHPRNTFLSPSDSFTKRVSNDVFQSLDIATLGGDFVGNDTLWFQKNPQGSLKPTALNSAHFLSKSFLGNLSKRGWMVEKKLLGQKFDAYFESNELIDVYDSEPSDYPSVIKEVWNVKKNCTEYPLIASKAWYEFVVRGFRISEQDSPTYLYENYNSKKSKKLLRVGLEFETGNIASSFRSLTKLSVLYKANMIDFGILVTFHDKANSACRLFPSSNRNGSFEELDKRQFRTSVDFPLWQIGFEPDRFDQNCSYLGNEAGKLFDPTAEGQELIDGVMYERYRSHDGRVIFKRQ